jgi:hypothetical protein
MQSLPVFLIETVILADTSYVPFLFSRRNRSMDRVTDPADPRRCQAPDRMGQCWNVAEPGCDYCRKHAGTDKDSAKQIRQYQLTNARLRQRLSQKTDHDQITSLREEIGLTKILIEELMNSCKTDTELLAHTGTFNQLAMTLEKLIKTSHQMEQSLGLLLSKPTLVVLGQDIIHILIEELKGVPEYEERIDRITGRMIDTIEHATNKLED